MLSKRPVSIIFWRLLYRLNRLKKANYSSCTTSVGVVGIGTHVRRDGVGHCHIRRGQDTGRWVEHGQLLMWQRGSVVVNHRNNTWRETKRENFSNPSILSFPVFDIFFENLSWDKFETKMLKMCLDSSLYIDWLIDTLIDWSIDQWIDWLIDWLID